MIIGKSSFEKGHTYIMGIMNLTPDSFSDGGRLNSLEEVLDRAEEMVSEGVDIIDIGGESTRPGFTQISVEDEIARIVPAVFAIKKMYDVPISVDTYKAEVARAALEAGADLINDVWGLQYKDGELMAKYIAEYGAACCLMHNGRDNENPDADIIASVRKGLEKSVGIALDAGIKPEKIILDPGIGFGKTYEQNMELLKHLNSVELEGYPSLLGASRKSVIGATLDLTVDERLEGTLATTASAVCAKYLFARVHDVKANKRFVKMFEALRVD